MQAEVVACLQVPPEQQARAGVQLDVLERAAGSDELGDEVRHGHQALAAGGPAGGSCEIVRQH